MQPYYHKNRDWRKYQTKLQLNNKVNTVKSKIKKWIMGIFICSLLIFGIRFAVNSKINDFARENFFGKDEVLKDVYKKPVENLKKRDIQALIKSGSLINFTGKSIDIDFKGEKFTASISVNKNLQEKLIHSLDKINSQYIGIVAMKPYTGEICAMAGYDRSNKGINPCVESIFPAASIFKIITAAAVVDTCGLKSNSQLLFNGSKYTLYKSQLNNKRNRYTNKISLANSFAQSVNPVFGKIGMFKLGKDVLNRYAGAFGFNQRIDFEIFLSKSQFKISDNPYNLAEIACGFNRNTLISPVHGAMITAVVVNSGVLIEPTIVEKISNLSGKEIYHTSTKKINCVISSDVSKEVKKLMHKTVTSGTARKSFLGYRRDKILKRLFIGGKTGSINNSKSYNIRYDWFVGFAEEKNGKEKLVVSVVVAHKDYIGKRAGRYARIAFKQYFSDFFAKADHPEKYLTAQSK